MSYNWKIGAMVECTIVKKDENKEAKHLEWTRPKMVRALRLL